MAKRAHATVCGVLRDGCCCAMVVAAWPQYVMLTESAVTRRLVKEGAEGHYIRPCEGWSVQVRYTVTDAKSGAVLEAAGTGDGTAPVTFHVCDGPAVGVLPCIDAGMREMRKGEVAVFRAPSFWAYGSPLLVRAEGAAALPEGAADAEVEAHVELVDYVKGKEPYDFNGAPAS